MLLNCGVGEDSWEVLNCKEIQPVHSKGNQSWDFFGRTDAKAETPVLWPPHAKRWLIGKGPDARRDWGQEEKGTTEWDGRMASPTRWTWVWVNSGVGDGQGGLAYCISWVAKSQTRLSNWTELNWTELNTMDWGLLYYEVPINILIYPLVTGVLHQVKNHCISDCTNPGPFRPFSAFSVYNICFC